MTAPITRILSATRSTFNLREASEYFNNTWGALELGPDKYASKARTLEKILAEQEESQQDEIEALEEESE